MKVEPYEHKGFRIREEISDISELVELYQKETDIWLKKLCAKRINPATYLGLENEIGQIKIGNKADLVILNSEMNVEKTFINGNLVYENE